MQLRVTRPGFMEGIAALKASQGVQQYQVNRDATRQEMRTFVCGQCHVEYHFKGPEKRLVYPWANGLKVENILAYYDKEQFKDWAHADTGAPVLKAQHPEFELWNQGIHARSGVACADCHMPYKREGALKISDHHVRSPLLNINRSCQTCHKWPEEELKARVENIQTRTQNMRNLAMDALVELIGELKAATRMARPPSKLPPRRICSARRSSISTSSKRRTPPVSTRRRKRCVCSANRSTSRAKDNSHCDRPSSGRQLRSWLTCCDRSRSCRSFYFSSARMLAMGLTLTPRAITAPLRDLRLVLLALALNFVVAPAFAWAVTRVIPPDPSHAIGLLLLGGAAGAPFLPKVVSIARGDPAVSAALVVLLTFGTILFIPFALPLMIPGLHADAWSLARPLVMFILLPLAVGMFVKSFASSLAARVAPTLATIGNAALLLLLVLLIALHFRALLGILGSFVVIAAVLYFAGLFFISWIFSAIDSRSARRTRARHDGPQFRRRTRSGREQLPRSEDHHHDLRRRDRLPRRVIPRRKMAAAKQTSACRRSRLTNHENSRHPSCACRTHRLLRTSERRRRSAFLRAEEQRRHCARRSGATTPQRARRAIWIARARRSA